MDAPVGDLAADPEAQDTSPHSGGRLWGRKGGGPLSTLIAEGGGVAQTNAGGPAIALPPPYHSSLRRRSSSVGRRLWRLAGSGLRLPCTVASAYRAAWLPSAGGAASQGAAAPGGSNGSGSGAARAGELLGLPSAWSLAPGQPLSSINEGSQPGFRHGSSSAFQNYAGAPAQSPLAQGAGELPAPPPLRLLPLEPPQQGPPQWRRGAASSGAPPAAARHSQPIQPRPARPPRPSPNRGAAAGPAAPPAAAIASGPPPGTLLGAAAALLPAAPPGDAAAAAAISAAFSIINLSQQMMQRAPGSPTLLGGAAPASPAAARHQLQRQLELTIVLQREALCKLLQAAEVRPRSARCRLRTESWQPQTAAA